MIACIVPKRLEDAIEKVVTQFKTIEVRPPKEFEELFSEASKMAADMQHSVAPVYEEFKDLLQSNVKGEKYVTNSVLQENGTIKHFIGIKHGENLYGGKCYLMEDEKILSAIYGLFNHEPTSKEVYYAHGICRMDFLELSKINHMSYKYLTMENNQKPDHYFAYCGMTDGARQFQWMEKEEPSPIKPTFFISKKGVLRTVVRIKEGVYKVYAVTRSAELDSIEVYYVDKGNQRLADTEQVKYDSNGRYFHRIEGRGTCILDPNTRYDGCLTKDFEMTGEGCLITVSPRKMVTGTFDNGKITTGTINTDDYHYEGDIANLLPNGRGRKAYHDKDIVEGFFVDGQAQGKGKFISYCCESTFEGDLVDGVKAGYGVEVFNNGDRYEGEFKQGRFCGKGKMNFANGDVYVGHFDGGVFHGEGELKTADATLKCTWTHGHLGERNEDHVRVCCSGHASPSNRKRV